MGADEFQQLSTKQKQNTVWLLMMEALFSSFFFVFLKYKNNNINWVLEEDKKKAEETGIRSRRKNSRKITRR